MEKNFDELLQIRNNIVNAIKSELIGPGSDVSYPDKEHELISEWPAKRYSVGILYPQNLKYNLNEEEDENPSRIFQEDDEIQDEEETKEDFNLTKGRSLKDESFDDDINLALQNKPSSMGMTFFISANINSIDVQITYAKYRKAADDEIIIPFEDNLFIPECLNHYIKYDKDKHLIQKGQSLRLREIDDIFEVNGIEDPILLSVLRNLNMVFKKGNTFKRCPFDTTIKMCFDGEMAKADVQRQDGTKDGYLTAIKRKIADDIFSITIMFVNDIDDEYIFQPQISVNNQGVQDAKFVSNSFISSSNTTEEEQSLELLYRKKLIFATGHGVSVDWNIRDGLGKIHTEFIPMYEVPKISFELRRETDLQKSIDNGCLSMKYLSDLNSVNKVDKLSCLSTFLETYSEWISSLEIERNAPNFNKKYNDIADKHIAQCKESCSRMKEGLSILDKNDNAWKAFMLANRSMFIQRIHIGFQQSDNVYPDDESVQNKLNSLNYEHIADEYYWRPFQLAFLLMSIKSIVDPSSDDRDCVDLIWFPTGGGKTEAYLGLTAFTIFFRRLQNPQDGGTTVIMRYTLRLLTSQQFTRAATLICACEKIRKDEQYNGFRNYNLGREKISIGLWIGNQHTPNTNEEAKKELKELTQGNGDLKSRKDYHNKFQVLKCPWCGTKLIQDENNGQIIGQWGYKTNGSHFYMHCPQEGCEFEEVLPIQIVDEELYSNPPTLLFATVDKFAMMAWKKDIKAFFGGAKTSTPDLIIQDELHLIAGPLGTMVGIYETAIDYLCSQRGKRPKIIASTATIRSSEQQCRALYNRQVKQFPAQGLDASDSFFAKELPIEEDFGRMYLGVMPSGISKVMLQARAAATVLQFVHELDCPDEQKDLYYTLAIYFNSIKELGKSVSVISDDTKDYIKRLQYRHIGQVTPRNIGIAYELTSRVTTTELNDTLDKLEHLKYSKANIADKKYPINVLLASNMISVGVDVARLNLMYLQGQPKAVSEYIQASSRIGRKYPGLAVTLYDPSKSRDRSYYEQFKAFHSSFYKYVEPTGITPFSSPARDRALHAVFVSGLRQSIAELNNNNDAKNIIDEELQKKAEEYLEYIYERAKSINSFNPEGMSDDSDELKKELQAFLQDWKFVCNNEKLTYGDSYIVTNAPAGTPRIIKTFDDKNIDNARRTLTSLRNVEKTTPSSVIVWEGEYDEC